MIGTRKTRRNVTSRLKQPNPVQYSSPVIIIRHILYTTHILHVKKQDSNKLQPKESKMAIEHEPPALPATHRALVLSSVRDPLDITLVPNHPTPSPVPGSAVVRILATGVISYAGEVYSGIRSYPFPKPMVPGSSAIGRVAAVGPDAASLKPGQLVFLDSFVRGRDDDAARILLGVSDGVTDGSRKLMRDAWRDGTFAEYARLPLENCYALDEARLLGSGHADDEGGLGYAVEDLLAIGNMLVPYGGLRDVGLQAGEKVVVAPATGMFGGSAVPVALAMGAGKVVAMGRNEEMLARLRELGPRVRTVSIVGDVEAETKALREDGPANVFFDISPPGTAGSSYFKAGCESFSVLCSLSFAAFYFYFFYLFY